MTRILTTLLLCAAFAQARWIVIKSFDAEITVKKNGTIEVVEKLTVEFNGSWNGIYRDFLYRYETPSGIKGRLRLELIDVSGDIEWFKQRKKDGNLRVKIKVSGAHDAARTVVLRYRVRNALRNYGELDELYWNVTGTDWPYEIKSASARVTLPESIDAASVKTTAYTGRYGERGVGAKINGLTFATTRGLRAKEGLTIVVGFPDGHVEVPGFLTRTGWFFADNAAFLLPLFGLLVWFLIWWFNGRDSLEKATIVAEYEPPLGLRPTEVGVLADEVVHTRDVTACVLDLAVRGVVTIERDEEQDDFLLRVEANWRENEELKPYEVEILSTLFGYDESVWMDDRKARFASALLRIKRSIHRELSKAGLFERRVDTVRAKWMGLTLGAVVILGVLGFIATNTNWFWIPLVVCAVPMFILARHMPKRTRRGLEALRRIRGMEEYMETAESERMKTLPLGTFEKLLPYAVALNLHDRWLHAFRGLYETPAWMGGSDAGLFHTHLLLFMTTSHDTVSYTPRSSGSGSGWSGGSGFSGGGFSGGGMGGGGGGGW